MAGVDALAGVVAPAELAALSLPAPPPCSLAAPLVSTTVRGTTVGLERPLALVAVPLALAALLVLVVRGDGTAGVRSRRLLVASRLAIVLLLATAAAGPYTVTAMETPGDPRVTLLTDNSDSMAVTGGSRADLADRIEAQGVPVTEVEVASGAGSPIGDALAANLRENGTVVVASDGRVTRGRSLAEAGELAASLNATVAAVRTDATTAERHVSVNGPPKTSVGVRNAFLVSVDGVNLEGSTATVTVTVDGTQVASEQVTGTGAVEFAHAFESTGEHRIVAEVSGDDRFDANDVARRTVRVVEQPRILYVADRNYPLSDYLSRVYRVDTARAVPDDLSPYYAVVLQNKPADRVGNVTALQEFVIEGNGLLVAGGSRSFERGGYDDSALGSMLPVRTGEESGSSANVVLAIDISGSAREGMRTQKAVALSVLEQLGEANSVGLVAFNENAYAVTSPARLGSNRALLEDRIRRLKSGGGTSIGAGLQGARAMLGGAGTIILITDGRDRTGGARQVAERLGDDVRVITVGTGPSPSGNLLRRIADATGGTYIRADETTRLRLLFGDADRTYGAGRLTVVDRSSFVTSGVTLRSNPGLSNAVTVKPGADYLVATGTGSPAVASWRYGLGRVVTVTAYDSSDTLDGLLSQPDSLLVTKATNYVIGDPERRASGVTEVPDTRVGEPTTVTYRGTSRPTPPGVEFRQAGTATYRAAVTPEREGFESILDADYAVDAHREYTAFGIDPTLRQVVEETGGQFFPTSDAAGIASFARDRARQVREVRQSWTWLALLAALVLFAIEVLVRRVQVYRGRAENESGLS